MQHIASTYTRKLADKLQQTSSQVKDKEGNILTSEDEQLKRWGQYFDELLNRPPPPEVPSIPEASAECVLWETIKSRDCELNQDVKGRESSWAR